MKKILLAILLIAILVATVGVATITWRKTPEYKYLCNIVDLKDDDKINWADFAKFAQQFGRNDCWKITNNWCNGTDFNRDGRVDRQDMYILKGWWLKECSAKKHN